MKQEVIKDLNRAELEAACNVQEGEFETLIEIGKITILGEKEGEVEAYFSTSSELENPDFDVLDQVDLSEEEEKELLVKTTKWIADVIAKWFILDIPYELDPNSPEEEVAIAKEYARDLMRENKINFSEGLEESYACCYFAAIDKIMEMHEIVTDFYLEFKRLISNQGYSEDIFVENCTDEDLKEDKDAGTWLIELKVYLTDTFKILIDIDRE